MKRSGLVLAIFKWLLSTLIAWAQTPEASLQLARQAYQTQNYAYAVELYERVLFFKREAVNEQAFQQISQCYVAMQQYDKAALAYQTCASLAANDSSRNAYFLKVAWCQLNQRAFQEALITLYNLPGGLPVSLQRESDLYTGVAAFSLGQFEDAHQAFRQYVTTEADRAWVDSLFQKNQRLGRRFNPKVAKTLSIILPGSGHMYAGDLKNGINSLLLLSGLVAIGINYMTYYTWFDSLISVAPWFQRYYFGGFRRAEQATRTRLSLERNKLLVSLLQR